MAFLETLTFFQTNLVTFPQQKADPEFSPVLGNSCSQCDTLLGTSFGPQANAKSKIELLFIAKDAGKMLRFMSRSRIYLAPSAMVYFYKNQFRSKLEYCYFIWDRCAQSLLSILDRVQKNYRGLVDDGLSSSLQPLCHRRNISGLPLF